MRGTEKRFTKAAVVTGLTILPSVFGAGSAIAWTVTTDISAYNMDESPSVLDGSASDGNVSEDSGTDMDYAAQELSIQDEMEGLQQFLDKVVGRQDGIQGNFSFWELMKEPVEGNLKGILGQAGAGIQNTLFSEVRRGGHVLLQVAAIRIVGAVFLNISSMLKGGQISDVGFFVTYIPPLTCLAVSFAASLQVAAQVPDQVLGSMKLIISAYFMSVAFSGRGMSALALHEGMLGTVTLVQWVYGMIPLSMVKIYILMVLGSHVVKEALLAKLIELLEQTVGWGLKTLTGLVVEFHLIQSMILPYVDATGQAGMKRLLEIIPSLGQGTGAMIQMVLGSGVLIKSTMEVAAVVVLAMIIVIPTIRLMVLMVFYQYVAAVIQPMRDKRVVSCASGVSKGHKLSIQIMLCSMFLFMIPITVTCTSTNMNYFTS